MKTKNVSFYLLSHVLSDSVINFIQVRYQNVTIFVITEKYTDRELLNCYQWSWLPVRNFRVLESVEHDWIIQFSFSEHLGLIQSKKLHG